MSISVNKTNRRGDSGKHLYKIKAEEVHKAFDDIFSVYCSEIIDEIKIATNNTAEELKQMLIETSPKDDGEYALSWDWTMVYDSPLEERDAVFNRDHWQLIHLLEFGHQSRNQWNAKQMTSDGKREKLKTTKKAFLYETKSTTPDSYGFVSGKPHFMPTLEKGNQIFLKNVKEAIKDAK